MITPRTAVPLLALMLGSYPLAAQSLPPYIPVNPVQTARSGLYTQPYIDAGKTWEFRALMDLANMIEYQGRPSSRIVLDAEVLRVDLTATRNLGNGFVGASIGFNASNDGFLDGFLDWYHNLTGLQVAAREVRPRNQFEYLIKTPAGDSITFPKHRGFLGDLRLIAGHRHTSHWQTTVAVTLPVGAPEGYGRQVVSASLLTTARAQLDHRWTAEGGLGIGTTPKHGALSEYQRTVFASANGGVRFRFWGQQAAFINLFYHTPTYQGTTVKPLDNSELTLDYGFLLKAKKGPEWFFGMTEDLLPSGPAVDLSFRIGMRW